VSLPYTFDIWAFYLISKIQLSGKSKVNAKLSLQEAVETSRFVIRKGPYIFYKMGSQMAVKLSALCTGGPLT
jgi:hypothetical protein